ncbi:3-hydroxybutyryl-CoA dehydratase [Fusarium austroafricanum]|uniref:3-hydroxybutyryl-CoA dehydratase n=1 Tax=Fusarium austroafricanum TaxID=2364996 RepID=A0A8H4NRW8_9HYPO|nr:3-hydroxybutyryl-CoA dehydratase [Fusarium austroafricanum]
MSLSPAPSFSSSEDEYLGDSWPRISDGTRWARRNLLELLEKDESPFSPIWDVKVLLQEVKDKLGAEVADIPCVYTGSNNYICIIVGFRLNMADQRNVLALLGNADVNMPLYAGFTLSWLHKHIDFEAATYEILQEDSDVPTDRLLYCRHPVQHELRKELIPDDMTGRRLMIFEMAKGQGRLWTKFDQQQRVGKSIVKKCVSTTMEGSKC